MSFVEGNLSLGIELAPGTLDRLKSQLAQLEKGTAVKVNVDATPAAQAIKKLEGQAAQTGNTITNKLGNALKGVGQAAGVLGTVGAGSLVALGTKAILAGKEFNILQQQVRAGLKAVLGTTSAAEGLLRQVNLLNDTSPFPRSAFLSATQQLVGFGVEAQKVTPILDAIQNAVAGIGGDANDIQMFTRAFAQIKSQGRLTGDVLFSLGAKGVDAAAIIGKQMGKTGTQIKDEVSKGAIGADKAIDLLTKGLKEKFDGATESVAQSFLGAKDRVTARLRDIGAALTRVFITPAGGGAAVVGLNNIADGLKSIRDNVLPKIQPLMQSLADAFVKVTGKFKEFSEGLKGPAVTKFLDIIRMAIPIIGAFAANFSKGILGQIPLLARFAPAMNGPLVAIGLLVAAVPQLRDQFSQLVSSLQPLADALLPAIGSAFKTLQGTVSAVAPALAILVSAVRGLAAIITPIVTALQGMGVLGPILAIIALRMLAVKVAGSTAFTAVATGAQTATMGIRAATFAMALNIQSMGVMRTVGALAMTAVQGIGSALMSLVNPANAAVAVITIIGTMMANANAKAQELVGTVTKGLNLEESTDLEKSLTRVNNLLKDQEKANKSQSNMAVAFSWLPWVDNTSINAAKSLKELRKEKERIEGAKAVKKLILDSVIAQTGRTAEEVETQVKSMNITLTDIPGQEAGETIKKITTALKEVPTAAENAATKLHDDMVLAADALDKVTQAQTSLKSSTRALEDAQRKLSDLQKVTAQELKDRVVSAQLSLESAQIKAARSADRMTQAQIALAQAQRAAEKAVRDAAQAEQHLSDLQRDRARLIADVNNESREMARAYADVAKIQTDLIDLDERQADLLREREDLISEGPDKIAAADRQITRSQIALNTAKREELELQKEINKEDNIFVDLSGLSVDQIKTRLAGVKSQVAVQRGVTKQRKSEEQKADELLTARLNTIDAEYGVKKAIEDRGDTELDIQNSIRENDEALNQLNVDRAELLRQQEEKQISINNLIADGSTKARTLRDLDNEIADAVDGVKSAHEDVITAAITVRDRTDDIKQAVIDAKNEAINLRTEARNVRDAMQESRDHARDLKRAIEDTKTASDTVKKDGIAYKDAIAQAKGDQEAINRALLSRIGLNSALLAQEPALLQQTAEKLLGPLAFVKTRGGDVLNQGRINELMDILLNHPQDLIKFFQNLGMPLAEGGVVRQHTFAQIGERGKAEVVLPLTKPGRSMTLLAQSIPLMHTALQKKIAPLFDSASLSPVLPQSSVGTVSRSLPSVRSSGNPVISKKDGPATYGQIQELIALMKDYKREVHVEAPITVTPTGVDEEMLIRKISKRLERQIHEILSRR